MLRIVDLVIEYTQGGYVVRPVDGLNFAAQDGELVILLGPSGSGKTTLLSCVSSLLRPKSGTIHVGGTEVTALTGPGLQRYRRETVGIIFQALTSSLASLRARMWRPPCVWPACAKPPRTAAPTNCSIA